MAKPDILVVLCVQNRTEQGTALPRSHLPELQFIFLRFRWLTDAFCTGKGRESVPSLWF